MGFRIGFLKSLPTTSNALVIRHLVIYQAATDVVLGFNRWACWHPFGIVACVLMIVTRSIWVVVIYHALTDWSVVFDKVSSDLSDTEKWNPGFWDALTFPFFNLAISIGLAALLLRLDCGGVPRWAGRLAIKWKLVKPELGLVA